MFQNQSNEIDSRCIHHVECTVRRGPAAPEWPMEWRCGDTLRGRVSLWRIPSVVPSVEGQGTAPSTLSTTPIMRNQSVVSLAGVQLLCRPPLDTDYPSTGETVTSFQSVSFHHWKYASGSPIGRLAFLSVASLTKVEQSFCGNLDNIDPFSQVRT